METVKNVSNFCNATIFYDYKNIVNIEKVIEACRCIFNDFHETIPVSRILITLSNFGVVNLKINDIDIEIVIEIIQDLRAKILFMIGFEKVLKVILIE